MTTFIYATSIAMIRSGRAPLDCTSAPCEAGATEGDATRLKRGAKTGSETPDVLWAPNVPA